MKKLNLNRGCRWLACVAALGSLGMAQSLWAGDKVLYDFSSAGQIRVESLEAKFGWKVEGREGITITQPYHVASALRIGGALDAPPRVSFALPKLPPNWAVEFDVGASVSYANARIILKSAGKSIASISVSARNVLEVEGAVMKRVDSNTNPEMDMATIGMQDLNNHTVVRVTGAGGKLTVKITQPAKADSPLNEVFTLSAFNGVPDSVVIETLKHDQHSRLFDVYRVSVGS